MEGEGVELVLWKTCVRCERCGTSRRLVQEDCEESWCCSAMPLTVSGLGFLVLMTGL